jgi:Flp pilus assembly pilin Flp
MHNGLLKLYMTFQDLTNGEQGQDLVEYALLCLLLALAAITSVNHVAALVNQLFANISSSPAWTNLGTR